jgi:hypothetical protein
MSKARASEIEIEAEKEMSIEEKAGKNTGGYG